MFEGTVLSDIQARSAPDGTVLPGWIKKGAVILSPEMQATWMRIGTINGAAATGWVNAGANMSKINWHVIATPPPPPPPPVTVANNWTVTIDELSNGTDNVKVLKNGVVFSDVTK